MVRLIALYATPDDPAAFDEHYRSMHAPIVARYPGIREVRVTRLAGLGGRAPSHYLMAEMAFDSLAELDAALASDPGRESGRDLRNFAQAGVTLFVADDRAALDV